jgi:hypothetical protein
LWLCALALCSAGVLGSASQASAQRALQQVLDLNRQAMDAYNNLEIEQAMALLNQALQAAQRGRVTGAPLARTYMNLGVVAIGGLGDNGAGLNYFVQALQADPNVQLDPLTSTPDIQTTFALARQRAGVGGGTGAGTGGGTVRGTGGDSGGAMAPQATGNLPHVAVPEQLTQTAVPVYIEVPGGPAHVYLYYRAHGMRDFRRIEMERLGGGYAAEIPCTDVFEPELAYYIVAFGSDGSPLGFAGSQAQPYVVPIVATRSQPAPALPGRAPPQQCRHMDEECPPGMPCAGRGTRGGGRSTGSGGGGGGGGGARGSLGLGDACSRDSECQSGSCRDGFCAFGGSSSGGESGGGGSSSGGSSSSSTPRFFVRVGAGLGASVVVPGMRADRVPCNSDGGPMGPDGRLCDEAADGPVEYIEGWRYGDVGLWQRNGYEPAHESDEAGRDASGNFAATSCPIPLQDDNLAHAACLYVRDSGLVANFQIRAEVGYFVLDWFGISLFARFQPISGFGPLSLMLIGARLHFRLLDVSTPEFIPRPFVHLHVGGSAGQIQVQVPNNGPQAPWGTSGLGGAHVGATVGYRFTPNVGIFFEPDVMFQFPNFLFNIDLHAGVEFGF